MAGRQRSISPRDFHCCGEALARPLAELRLLAMTVPPKIRPRRQVRAILSSTALLSFMSVRKAATLAVAQLGIAAFFVAGTTRSALGESAAWFVLFAAVLAAFVRAIDIEGWALFIPGGFVGRVQHAFGPRSGQSRRRYRTGRAPAASRPGQRGPRTIRGHGGGHGNCGVATHRLRQT